MTSLFELLLDPALARQIWPNSPLFAADGLVLERTLSGVASSLAAVPPAMQEEILFDDFDNEGTEQQGHNGGSGGGVLRLHGDPDSAAARARGGTGGGSLGGLGSSGRSLGELARANPSLQLLPNSTESQALAAALLKARARAQVVAQTGLSPVTEEMLQRESMTGVGGADRGTPSLSLRSPLSTAAAQTPGSGSAPPLALANLASTPPGGSNGATANAGGGGAFSVGFNPVQMMSPNVAAIQRSLDSIAESMAATATGAGASGADSTTLPGSTQHTTTVSASTIPIPSPVLISVSPVVAASPTSADGTLIAGQVTAARPPVPAAAAAAVAVVPPVVARPLVPGDIVHHEREPSVFVSPHDLTLFRDEGTAAAMTTTAVATAQPAATPTGTAATDAMLSTSVAAEAPPQVALEVPTANA
jgi:hypothetical protein